MNQDDIPTQQFAAYPDEAPTQPSIRLSDERPGGRPGRRWWRWGLIALIAALWIAGIIAIVVAALFVWRPHPTLAQVSTMPPMPAGWPAQLELGMSNGVDGAAEMRQAAPFGIRYQYLAGGVNTGGGWTSWAPDGTFVTNYMRESSQQRLFPIFTYYMLGQSSPGRDRLPNESDAVGINVTNAQTMAAYYRDLQLLFRRAGALPNVRVVLHVEPDLWGFLHQRAKTDNASEIRVVVGSSGIPELADLPDNLAGFAQAIVRMRDRDAPNVLLAYHVSSWGTGTDIFINNSWDITVDEIARREAALYASLGANFDLVFAECSDRDAAFKQFIYHDRGRSWWDADDYLRQIRFLTRFVDLTGKRIVLWQLPYGNTRMRAMDNTWNHFQDTRVEWLLDDPGRAHLRQYLGAGVIAILFGRGADGATDASDAAKDGITNPAPINGNDRLSLSADDDGGYFKERAAAYYREGPLPLP
jgi:hypothetical protein